MKDDLGQERHSVRARELAIAAVMLLCVGAALWTVALPALTADPNAEPDGASEAAQAPATEPAPTEHTNTDKPPQ